jgi:hypothetical protein
VLSGRSRGFKLFLFPVGTFSEVLLAQLSSMSDISKREKPFIWDFSPQSAGSCRVEFRNPGASSDFRRDRRPVRVAESSCWPPNYEAEQKGARGIGHGEVENPSNMPQKQVEMAVELCKGGYGRDQHIGGQRSSVGVACPSRVPPEQHDAAKRQPMRGLRLSERNAADGSGRSDRVDRHKESSSSSCPPELNHPPLASFSHSRMSDRWDHQITRIAKSTAVLAQRDNSTKSHILAGESFSQGPSATRTSWAGPSSTSSISCSCDIILLIVDFLRCHNGPPPSCLVCGVRRGRSSS